MSILKHDMRFADVVEWCRTFHVLTPFVIPQDSSQVDSLVNRLKRSGAVVDERVATRTKEALVRCTCNLYQNYAWCVHACLWAIHKKVITSLPMLRHGVASTSGSVLLNPQTMSLKAGSKRKDTQEDPYDTAKYARRGGGLDKE